MGRFDGKIAVITGGNSGIGPAAAQQFEAQGARVVVTGRDAMTLRYPLLVLGRRKREVKQNDAPGPAPIHTHNRALQGLGVEP